MDALARKSKPLFIDEKSWTRTFFRSTLRPGQFIFINRGQYFTRVSESAQNLHILVSTFKRSVRFEYYVDSRNMFGTTSITVSFSGHKSVASLLVVKSVEDVDGQIVVYCTPLAMGVGFHYKP